MFLIPLRSNIWMSLLDVLVQLFHSSDLAIMFYGHMLIYCTLIFGDLMRCCTFSWCIFFYYFILCDLYKGWFFILGYVVWHLMYLYIVSFDFTLMVILWCELYFVLDLILIKLMYVIQRHGTLQRCNRYCITYVCVYVIASTMLSLVVFIFKKKMFGKLSDIIRLISFGFLGRVLHHLPKYSNRVVNIK